MERWIQDGMKSSEAMMAREDVNGEQFAQGLQNAVNNWN